MQKREIELSGIGDSDADYEGMLGTAIVELMEVFAKQGHSGYSAGMVLHIFSELASFKNLTPLTNDPGEWNDVSDMSGRPMWQNQRNSEAFSWDSGKTYYELSELNGAAEKDYPMHTAVSREELKGNDKKENIEN